MKAPAFYFTQGERTRTFGKTSGPAWNIKTPPTPYLTSLRGRSGLLPECDDVRYPIRAIVNQPGPSGRPQVRRGGVFEEGPGHSRSVTTPAFYFTQGEPTRTFGKTSDPAWNMKTPPTLDLTSLRGRSGSLPKCDDVRYPIRAIVNQPGPSGRPQVRRGGVFEEGPGHSRSVTTPAFYFTQGERTRIFGKTSGSAWNMKTPPTPYLTNLRERSGSLPECDDSCFLLHAR